MNGLMMFGFTLLATWAVWNSTEQRLGTTDELRTLAAAIVAILITAGLVILGAVPAGAHTPEEISAWKADWLERAVAGPLTSELLEELADFRLRYISPEVGSDTENRSSQPTSSRPAPSRPSVEHWRPLVAKYFTEADVETALCLIWHESRGDPTAKNPSSSAAGLFQILDFWWEHFGGDRYDPETNIATASKIRAIQGWSAWSPWNRGLCR